MRRGSRRTDQAAAALRRPATRVGRPPEHGVHADAGDRRAVHPAAPLVAGGRLGGDLEELGGHHLWRQRGGVDPGAAQLVAERLGEAEDEALGGRVAGVQGRRLVGADRGDVEDPARAAVQHARQEQLGQVHGHDHVQLEHGPLALPVQLAERAVEPEPGVVDQHVHRQAVRLGAGREPVGGTGLVQVEGDHPDVGAGGGQLPLEGPQPVLPPGHQGEAGAAPGQLAGEVGSEAAGGPGNQRVPARQGGRGARSGGHDAHKVRRRRVPRSALAVGRRARRAHGHRRPS